MPLAEPRHAVSPARAADEIPAWFVWASLVLVGGPSLFALAYFQHRLLADLWVGTPDAMTYSLAVAVDTFGAMSGVYWFRSHRNTTLRGWGRFFAVAAVLGSTALTCWAIARLFGGPAAVAGVIPAVIVFGTTKQVTMWQADRAKNRDVLAEAAAQVADAEARAQAGQDRADAAEAEREGLAGRLAALEERLSSSEERTVRAERVASEDTGPIPAARSLAEASAGSKTERARAFIRAEWKAGREPSGGEVDAHVGGKSLGRAQIRWLRERGEFPPSERGDRHLASA